MGWNLIQKHKLSGEKKGVYSWNSGNKIAHKSPGYKVN